MLKKVKKGFRLTKGCKKTMKPFSTSINLTRFQFWFFILCLAFSASGCATVPREARVSAQRQVYLKDLCERYDIPLQWDHVAQVATLKINGEDVRVLAGSSIVLVGTQQVTLSAPVVSFRSSLKVPQDFKSKVIDRMGTKLAQRPPAFFSKLRGVIIDAGHGGKDPGAIGRLGLKEKIVTLDIAKRLRDELIKNNIEVVMTREQDAFIPLAKRARIANDAGADFFISRANVGKTVYIVNRRRDVEFLFH